VNDRLVRSGLLLPAAATWAAALLGTAVPALAVPGAVAALAAGGALAARIVAYRDAHGGFSSVDQLSEVGGIGPKTLAGLRDLVVP